MLSLGVDTSNYATSLAVVEPGRKEVVCALKRFLPVPEGARGLRQSDAVFHHTVALPALLEELKAKVELRQVAAVGVASKPRPIEGSYMPCFLAGVAFAEALAAGLGMAAVHTSHQQGHLAAAVMDTPLDPASDEERLFFHLSGGTTELLRTRGYEIVERLGGSKDLHAGQLVDRLGVQLGYPFPAGQAVSDLAEGCDEPMKPKVVLRGMECHLSGLENQYTALLQAGKPPAYVARYVLLALAASVEGLLAAARESYPEAPIICAGGVMASTVIRGYLAGRFDNLYFASPQLSSDNAVGVAVLAAAQAGEVKGWPR